MAYHAMILLMLALFIGIQLLSSSRYIALIYPPERLSKEKEDQLSRVVDYINHLEQQAKGLHASLDVAKQENTMLTLEIERIEQERQSMNATTLRIENAKHELETQLTQLKNSSGTTHPNIQHQRCALCFFGLPRAYKSMVLPSIERNLLIPNARHNCDIFVHYFDQNEEGSGRMNPGGKIEPTDVLMLENSTKKALNNNNNSRGAPLVEFVFDTDAQFMEKRKDLLHKYHNTKTADGKPAYFPWREESWVKSSLDNMVRQWHSIESVFQLMERHAQKHGITYSRVGMFRNDVMYLTPTDIYKLDQGAIDSTNQHAVVPTFAQYPVSDRMIYGPYEGVKIWSTKRFDLIEKRVQLAKDPGYEMHSERFMSSTIFPAIRQLGFKVVENKDICFVRTRADEAAVLEDCIIGGETRGFKETNIKDIIEDTLGGRNCTHYKMDGWRMVGCGTSHYL